MYRVVKEEAGRVCLAGWGGLGKVGGGTDGHQPQPFLLASAPLRRPPASCSRRAGGGECGRVGGWVCKRVGECASGRVSVQTCARNMEGGSGAAAAAAAAFTNIYTAAFTAGAIGTGSSLDEAERSVLSINHPQINAPRRCFLPPPLTLFSQKRSIQMLPYLRGMQLFPNWS